MTDQPPAFESLFDLPNPLAIFAGLRKTNPVFALPAPGFYAVTKYDDAVRILRDPETFSSEVSAASMRGEARPPTILFDDPPIHTRMRGLISKAFTPRVIELQRDAIQANCDDMIGRMCAKEDGDLIAELAYPLPVMVIASMLGVQDGDMATFKRWSDAIIENVGVSLFEGEAVALEEINVEFDTYFRAQLDKLRRHPEQNLLSELLRAETEDGRLSEEDLLIICRVLLVAGNETTTGLLVAAVRAMAAFPHVLPRLRAAPALIPSFIEEALRYYPPFPATIRRTMRDVEVRGVTIPAQSRVLVMLASANHDEDVFERADEFIVDREPNRHIAFGMGIHYCLGAPLARLEANIAMQALVPRITGVTVADPEAASTMKPGGPAAMAVRFELDRARVPA
jgi:cytochrome P450